MNYDFNNYLFCWIPISFFIISSILFLFKLFKQDRLFALSGVMARKKFIISLILITIISIFVDYLLPILASHIFFFYKLPTEQIGDILLYIEQFYQTVIMIFLLSICIRRINDIGLNGVFIGVVFVPEFLPIIKISILAIFSFWHFVLPICLILLCVIKTKSFNKNKF